MAKPSNSLTSISWYFLKSSFTFAFTEIHSSKFLFVVAKTLSIDFFVYGLGELNPTLLLLEKT